MKPSPWPDWLDDLWAKSPEKGAGGEPESLAQHTWSVLERLADFIRLRPQLPEQLSQPHLWQSLYWGAFLHDFGKAMPAFQGVLRGDPEARERWGGHRHEVFSLAFLDWITEGFNNEETLWAAAAIVSHHRDAADVADLYPPNEPDFIDPLYQQFEGFPADHAAALHRWIVECGWPWAVTLELDHVGITPVSFVEKPEEPFAQWGVGTIRKWLHNYQKFNRRLTRDANARVFVPLLALRGTLINSDHSASAHALRLPKISFDASRVLSPLMQHQIAFEDLYQHQRQAASTEGSALLIAPTGSGKTEAALLWASRQAATQPNGLPRLFYTLPYQASMNAMSLRLQKTYGEDYVGLQHGRSLLSLYRMLLEQEYSPSEAKFQARWRRNLAKLNYPPVRVFSPYQMLKGMYRLKGYEALLTDYHYAAFVFDEIHAYEVQRLAIILKMIEYLRKNYQARFLVMTATFPTLIKKWLVGILDSPAEIQADPELFKAFQRHRINVIDGDLLSDESLFRIVQTAQSGKSVLVVCNLVDRAQKAFQELNRRLANRNISVELLHGRFNMRDRSRKEQVIRDATGSYSLQRHPVVLVATQVIEVSLDIDLDVIFTDPAPLEALVQRFGRINRRRKQTSLAPVYIFCQPDDGQKIYDPALVKRSLAILKRENEKPLDEGAVGAWLDEIYEGEMADRWQKAYTQTASEFEEACIHTLRPFASDQALEKLFYQAFDNIEVLPELLYDEYDRLKDENPILAGELLVPISWGRYHALTKYGQVLSHDKHTPPVVRARYSSQLGLVFDSPSSQSDDAD